MLLVFVLAYFDFVRSGLFLSCLVVIRSDWPRGVMNTLVVVALSSSSVVICFSSGPILVHLVEGFICLVDFVFYESNFV